jgi:hypothetical protein
MMSVFFNSRPSFICFLVSVVGCISCMLHYLCEGHSLCDEFLYMLNILNGRPWTSRTNSEILPDRKTTTWISSHATQRVTQRWDLDRTDNRQKRTQPGHRYSCHRLGSNSD